MATSLVIIESRDLDTGERSKEVFEITPAPEPGNERRVLAEVVAGMYPGAIERASRDGVMTFRDGQREIMATVARETRWTTDADERPEAQGRLFTP